MISGSRSWRSCWLARCVRPNQFSSRLVCSGLVLLLAGMGCSQSGGVDAPAEYREVSLHVDGMMCPDSCAKTVQEILASQPGVHEAVVEYEREQATCRVDPQSFDVDAAVADLADQDFVAKVQP